MLAERRATRRCVQAPDGGLAVRLRVSHLLSTVDFTPDDLPPGAILLVRRMADPLPGALLGERDAMAAPPAWERAAREVLRDHQRRAVRPARQSVPADAMAVLFDDMAQLLSCIARDLVRGEASRRWWWRAWLRGLDFDPARALAELFSREARYLPAAIEALHVTGEAARVVAALPPAKALEVARAVATAYQLPELAAALGPARLPSPDVCLPGGLAPNLHSIAEAAEDGQLPGTPASASAVVELIVPPEILAGPQPAEQRALLLTALAIRHAPDGVRRPAFAGQVARWLWRELRRQNQPSAEPGGPLPSRGARDEMAQPAPPSLVEKEPVRAAHGAPRREPVRGLLRLVRNPARVPEPLAVSAETSRAQEATLAEAVCESAEGVQTGLGGVFYLVNVVLGERLLDLLEDHFRAEARFGPWGWVELLARCLLVPASPDDTSDPVWRALAVLDGREPGTSLPLALGGHACFTVPASWREVLADSAGDVYRRTSPYRLRRPLGLELPRGMRRLLEVVAPFIRWRLCDALHAPPAGIAAAALERPARLYVTSTQVDLVLDQEQVSVPVRLAGLDADPGWVPVFSRVLRFHYR